MVEFWERVINQDVYKDDGSHGSWVFLTVKYKGAMFCFVFLSVWTFKSCPVCVCMCVGEDKYALVSVFILVCMEAKGQHQESFSIFLHLSF